jgi:2-hydroxychromene-2-carboxylate isomerase
VAVLGMREGWGEQYVCAAYRRWFQHGEENGGEQNLWAALAECDQNFERVVAQARSEATQHDLDAETEVARRIGLFGSPSYVIGSEIFWGADRLEDAISWSKHGQA